VCPSIKPSAAGRPYTLLSIFLHHIYALIAASCVCGCVWVCVGVVYVMLVCAMQLARQETTKDETKTRQEDRHVSGWLAPSMHVHATCGVTCVYVYVVAGLPPCLPAFLRRVGFLPPLNICMRGSEGISQSVQLPTHSGRATSLRCHTHIHTYTHTYIYLCMHRYVPTYSLTH